MRELLPQMPKPSHYAGAEDGVKIKDPSNITLRAGLIFPDTYEVGMSYLGHKILYAIGNAQKQWAVERVMAPEPEACEILRTSGTPLTTLETDSKLSELDILGFAITHELCFTDILNILSLAHIPLRSANRGENLADWPIIMAGGGACMGAEPIMPFLDLAALGDGEELFPEILELLEHAKAKKWSKDEFLRQAAKIPGVYVPSLFQENQNGSLDPTVNEYRPRRRIVANLETAPYPLRQIVPVGAIHSRLSLEIARGCTRGCRFCHAGIVYRPVRERSPDHISDLLDKSLAQTGFDEVSFLALSAGDFTALKSLYLKAASQCQTQHVNMSLPSLRVGSVDDDIMSVMASIRRTGCTLAPEAGSQRLRDVINKGVTEADLMLHLTKLIEHGWRQAKLYFMIGLPTETDADLQAIVDLCKKARFAAGPDAPRLQLTVSISPFVPKPFTPFQWEEQIPLAEMKRRIDFLRNEFRGVKGIRLKWHEPAMSYLEGILSRGDRKLADVVEKAFYKGAVFCGWADKFQLEPWLESLEECGIDPNEYTRSRKRDDALPWQHLDCGVTDDFLWRERERAYAGMHTEDCRFGKCGNCGACDAPTEIFPNTSSKISHKLVFTARDQQAHSPARNDCGKLLLRDHKQTPPPINPELARKAGIIRFWHQKSGPQAYLSHLELQNLLSRALRRASLPVAFSQGFHPLPLLSFGRALPVGMQSDAEWFTLQMHSPIAAADAMSILNSYLPDGLRIYTAEETGQRAELSTQELLILQFSSPYDADKAENSLMRFLEHETWMITRTTKKGEKTENIRPYLVNWQRQANGLSFCLHMDWSANYLSPVLLCANILAPLVFRPGLMELIKQRQIFAGGASYGK